MSNFNVNAYWLERGRNYIAEKRTPAEFHRLQERFLLDVLKAAALPMGRILELGCGFGRITKLVAENWPDAKITALDLSPEQLANARRYCGENSRINFAQYDFYSGEPLPGNDFQVVLAIEVFLHHPPDVVIGLMRKLATVARFIVNVDWSESWSLATPEHVWVHDYAQLYCEPGLKCATFPLPAKVDGKQQKLFIATLSDTATLRTASPLTPALSPSRGEGEAASDLWARVLKLEDEVTRAMPATTASPASDDWGERLERASAELQNLIPSGAGFILVDDAQWGRLRALESYRVIPFLERDGEYWGPAADDATAWRELQRLRDLGATYVAFAWPSFWWLEHFKEFAQRLRTDFRCVLENERLVVFRLT